MDTGIKFDAETECLGAGAKIDAGTDWNTEYVDTGTKVNAETNNVDAGAKVDTKTDGVNTVNLDVETDVDTENCAETDAGNLEIPVG